MVIWLEKFKSLNCIEAIATTVCKQISCYSFKNEIAYKPFCYKSYMYIHLNVREELIKLR